MRENNNLDLKYEAAPTPADLLVDGADVAFHLASKSLAPPPEHASTPRVDTSELGRKAEREQQAIEAFLRTKQGKIGTNATVVTEMRREAA